MQDMPWDHGLTVTADGEGLVGHARRVILREMADRSGLTAALRDALARDGRFPEVDRGMAMVSAAVMIALGGTSMSGIAVLDHLALVLGGPVTWQTLRRTLDLADPATLEKIAQARAKIRAHVSGHWSRNGGRAGSVASDRGPGPGGLDGHRHGRHADHRALAEGKGRCDL